MWDVRVSYKQTELDFRHQAYVYLLPDDCMSYFLTRPRLTVANIYNMRNKMLQNFGLVLEVHVTLFSIILKNIFWVNLFTCLVYLIRGERKAAVRQDAYRKIT